jgi:hypothetical protein
MRDEVLVVAEPTDARVQLRNFTENRAPRQVPGMRNKGSVASGAVDTAEKVRRISYTKPDHSMKGEAQAASEETDSPVDSGPIGISESQSTAYLRGTGQAVHPSDRALCDHEIVPGSLPNSAAVGLPIGSGRSDRGRCIDAKRTSDDGALDRRDRIRQLAVVCIEMFKAADRKMINQDAENGTN